MAAGAVRLKKSHDIVILSFCNIVKGQAKCQQSIFYFQSYDFNHITKSTMSIFFDFAMEK